MHTPNAAKIKMGSERSFGFVFAAVFAIIGLWPLWSGQPVRLWSLGVGAAILALGLFRPSVLRPLNRLWFKFGMALATVTTPVFMAVLYYGVITPYGLLMRLFGVRLLSGRKGSEDSYWIARADDSPSPQSMRNQF